MWMSTTSKNNATHGPLCRKSDRSCQTDACCLGSGSMRSLVKANVTTKNMTAMAPQSAIVIGYPNLKSPPPNRLTKLIVNVFTRKAAVIAQTNRHEDKLVRSRESAVITPERAQYGMLLAA